MIRKACKEDYKIINILGEELIKNFTTKYDIENNITNANYTVLVNEDSGINAFMIVSENLSSYELEAIFVAKDYRRQNIASNLIINFLNNYYKGKKDIFLEVSIENKNAIMLYQKFNFKIINKRKKYYKGIDAYVMRREEK